MRLLATEQSTWATDARLALPAVAAWLSAAVALSFPGVAPAAAGTLAVLGVLLLIGHRSPGAVTVAALLCCAAAAAGSAAAHAAAAAPAVLTRAAAAGVTGQVELVLTEDPMPVTRPVPAARGRPLVRFSARLTRLDTAGRSTRLRAPVFVLAPADGWSQLLPSQRVRARARLAPAQPGELLGAVVLPRTAPTGVGPPGRLQRAAGTIRAGLHRGVGPLPAGPAALLPGLVVGDTSRLSAEVVAEFRATGLSHLVAVSGANLAIVVATVLAAVRRLGVGRRLGGVLAGLVMVGFVIVARPTPSVLRAAVMSAVVLIGLQEGRRSAAVPALAAATLGLVLVDPSLARAPGFALSVLATAGIVLFAVPLRRRMPGWLPGWLAEALAVPLAAQLACTPVLVALFGQLSLIAVPANLLAAPAVPPATVVGVLVGVTAPVILPAAQLLARLAQLPASWLLLVAHSGAGLPGAQLSWPSGASGAALAVVATAAGVVVIRRRILRAMVAVTLVSVLIVVGGLTRLSPAWPPAGWALVACDVGQGDGLVLAAGSGTAVVVDTGPDPVAMDRCLRALRVRRIPLVVLSHLHADHVEGLPGVLRNRRVGAIQIGPLEEPPVESARVRRWAAMAAVPLHQAVDGEYRTTGPVSWQVIAPTRPFRGTESDPNNSSIVLRVTLAGFTALLTGDIELAAQSQLVASGRDLSADVLKVAHHGSARQVPAFLDRVRPRLAVASVGADNDYGHPAVVTMAGLAAAGAHAFRTDRDGPVAFLRRGNAVVGVGRRGPGQPPVGRQLAGRWPDLTASDDPADRPDRGAPVAAQPLAGGAGCGSRGSGAGSAAGVAAARRPRLRGRLPQRPTPRVESRCRSPPATAGRRPEPALT